MLSKPVYTLIVFCIFFISSHAFAKKPSVSSLNYEVNSLKKQNTALNKTIVAQAALIEQQITEATQNLEKQSEINTTLMASLQQLQSDVSVLKDKHVSEEDNRLLYLLLGLVTVAIGLSLYTVFVKPKNNPENTQAAKRLDVLEASISKLSGQSVHHSHELSNLASTHGNLFKGFGDKLGKLDAERKLSYERRKAIEEELHSLLEKPITYEASESDRLLLNTLIEEDHLNFEETLQAKALAAEYGGRWQQGIVYWNTLLAENDNSTLALLHIGYSNYKLAEEQSQGEYYLEKATTAYNTIMTLAPEYFEDIYAYDDENAGADELVNDPQKVAIYQQIEQLVMKVNELRNYQSIYNLACQYAKEGKHNDAKNWLEQIALESYPPHCKHLKEDEALDSVRELPWFQHLLNDACEAS